MKPLTDSIKDLFDDMITSYDDMHGERISFVKHYTHHEATYLVFLFESGKWGLVKPEKYLYDTSVELEILNKDGMSTYELFVLLETGIITSLDYENERKEQMSIYKEQEYERSKAFVLNWLEKNPGSIEGNK